MGLFKPTFDDYMLNSLFDNLYHIDENTKPYLVPADATENNLIFEKTNEFTTSDTNGILCFKFRPSMNGKVKIEFDYHGKFILQIVTNKYNTGHYLDYFETATSYTHRSSTMEFALHDSLEEMDYYKVYLKSINGEPAYLKNFKLYGVPRSIVELYANGDKTTIYEMQ